MWGGLSAPSYSNEREKMYIYTLILILIPSAIAIAWLTHIAVVWHWDFKAWYHDSDNDI